MAANIAADEAAADGGGGAVSDGLRDLFVHPGRHDRDAGAGLAQQPQPPGGRLSTANDQGASVSEIKKGGKVSQWTSSNRKHCGPTENIRGALALGNAGASCPIKSRGSVSGGPSRKTQNPSQLWLGRVSSALAAFVKRPQAVCSNRR